MTHLMKIKDWMWKQGSNKEMLYQDDSNEWFVGSKHEVVKGNVYPVEISEGILRDGYRHIIKFK